MSDDQMGTQAAAAQNDTVSEHETANETVGHETQTEQPQAQQAAPAELRGVISELQDGPLDEDSVMDAEEGEDDEDETFVDADELFSTLAKIQTLLEEQSKEIRGLRREMREMRESQGGQQAPGGFQGSPRPVREDRPREDRPAREERSGGYQGREGGQSGFNRDRGERSGGYQGNREGGSFRPREDRPREGGYQGNREGGFRPREDRPSGDRPSGGYQGNREGGQGGFRPREDRPSGDRPQGGSDFRPRARADRGWGGGSREK